MAGTGKKWAIGCGIGCGVMLLILALVVGGGIFAGKRIAKRAETMEASFDRVGAEFGSPEDYTPPLDGRIRSDRMEAFFAARDAMEPHRMVLGRTLSVLDGDEGNFITKARAGLQLIPSLIDFIEMRNTTLIEAGIGVGEYQYIYALLSYGVGGMDPADGPGFSLVSDDNDNDGGWNFKAGEADEEDVRERREREIRKAINEFQVRIMENHLAAFDDEFSEWSSGMDGLDREEWRAQVAAELESLRNEHLKLMWEDGLPDHLREALAPYAARFVESYDPMTNVLEMGLVEFNE